MDTKKPSKEEKLEREIKTLVARMKIENAALQKILTSIHTDEKDTIHKPAHAIKQTETNTSTNQNIEL